MYPIFKNRSQEKLTLIPPQILQNKLPQHIAIVMDGNGRWATKRGLARIVGHQRGADALTTTIQICLEASIKYLTVFAFSTENWQRPIEEISGLMSLFRRYLKSELADAHKKNIRLRVIGNRTRMADDLKALIDHAVELTHLNTGLNLTIAFDYGGRDDIVNATRMLVKQVTSGHITTEQIDENLFSKALSTYDLPDPDLCIRTGQTSRISNFLIWQMAYTELVFIETCWPDFSQKDLIYAIEHFQKCERKFGQVIQK